MIQLYHCQGARSFRALWMLEEVEVPYRLHLLPFPPRRRSPGYLDVNPFGTIPYLVVDGVGMTESAAIVEYLAGRFGRNLAVASDAPAYPAYLNFLHMGEATLTFPQTIYLRYSRLEPDERRSALVAEDYRRWFLARLAVALSMFAGDYACDGRFTAADVSLGYAVKLAVTIGLRADLPIAATDYLARLADRPAYRRAIAAERRDHATHQAAD